MTQSRPFILNSRAIRRFSKSRRRAFTVLEMVVALAVFLVLLAAVFVPIKLAGDLSGVGIARASSQQAAVDGIRQIKSDITKAIVILPNDRTNGITNTFPYTANNNLPYRRDPAGYTKPASADTSDGISNPNACSTTVIPAPNTARLDLILPANNPQGSVDPALRNNNVLVSYYARRRDITKAFDPINNPVVLFRAQIPFQYFQAGTGPGSGIQPFPAWENTTVPNANLSNQRFSGTCNSRSLKWLTMNQYGEFDLTSLALPPAGASPGSVGPSLTPIPLTFGSHQLVLPRDTALLTPNAASDTTATNNGNMSLVPDTTFICSDSNKDGKIDTVTVQLSVGQYDENSVNRRTVPTPVGAPAGTSPRSALQPQIARTLTETVFDSNIQ